MAALISVLELYDAAESADLVDQDNYSLNTRGFAPVAARRSLSPLAGRGYDNVTETAYVDVNGSTGAAMLANAAKVARLLDKARRWSRLGQGGPVRLKVQAQGSTLASPLEAVVLGPPEGWVLPADFSDYLMVNTIAGMPVPWIRRGELLGAEETASASAAQHPQVYTATFGSSHDGVAAAVDVEVTGFSATTHTQLNAGILFASGRASGATAKLINYDAHQLTATGWTAVAEANEVGDAGGQVLRYSGTTTTERNSGILDISALSFDSSVQRVAVAVTLRNNAAARTFYLRAEGYAYDISQVDTTDTHVIDGTTYATPQPLLLGYINVRDGVLRLRLAASVDATTATPTLDIDQIILLAMDDDAYITKHQNHVLSSPFLSSGNARLFVDHRLYSDLTPLVGVHADTAGNEAPLSYDGDSLYIMRGDVVDVYWMSCNGADWVDTNQSSGARLNLGVTCKRRPIWTVPA